MERYEEAVPFLEKGIELKPHYCEADARLMLAEVYEQLGQIDKAATLWRYVIGMEDLDPSDDVLVEESKKKLQAHGLTESG